MFTDAPSSSQLILGIDKRNPRNAAADLRSYHFEYLERDWPTEPKLRQIVVQATNPQRRVVQVASLTDDRLRPAAEVIGLIFNRWIQEND